MNFSNKIAFVFFALFVVNTTTAEQLRYRQKDDGRYLVFIENAQAQPQQYSVDFLTLDQDELVATVSEFQPSLMKGILEAELSIESLPDGLYYLDLKSDGVSVGTAKPVSLIWDNEYLTQPVQVDRRTSELLWKPSAPCLARIVAVLPSGMMMDVVSSWKFYAVQEQALKYDFIGDDGRDLRVQANLPIFAQYIPLPLTVFVQGDPDFEAYASIPLVRALELPRTPLLFELSTNADLSEDDSGVYVGSDDISITVELSGETATRLNGKRFEILIYLDGEFIHEETQNTTPYNYLLPNFNATDRSQAVTVNVLDHLGNWGAQTLIFRFAQ